MKRRTTEQFLIEARIVHGDKYDYSKFEYIRSHDKGLFICPTHGEFRQIVKDHLAGRGCWACSGSKKYSKDDWITSARKIHGDKFDYSKVEYKNSQSKVTIVCPEHGDFEQLPASHMYGIGCSACAGLKKYTTESFIEKVIQVHGNKYDYSQVNIDGIKNNVIIICPEHGEFIQQAHSHMRGSVCPACVGRKKYSFEEWLSKARSKHGDKYDYSKVDFLDINSKISIICPEHGEIKQTLKQHINTSGCGYCGGRQKYSLEEWLSKARSIHGDKYDYSKVSYLDMNSTINIICPEHGEIKQTPKQHIITSGCGYCGGTKKHTKEIWVKKAIKIHGDKYDYTKSVYINSQSPITITCPEHGDFQQLAVTHTQGHDCPKCKDTTMDTQVFIEKSLLAHGNKYDYSLVEYINRVTKVTIICPEHGVFDQIPHGHYGNESGCPDCQEYGFNPKSPGYLYYFKIKDKNLYKIGITNKGVKSRYYKRDRDLIEKVYVEKYYDRGADAYKIEQSILKQFAEFLYEGEDILYCGGNTELFKKDVIGCSTDTNAFSVWESKFLKN